MKPKTETRKQALKFNKALLEMSQVLIEPYDVGFELVDVLIEKKADEKELVFLLELLTYLADSCAQNVALQIDLREKVLKQITGDKAGLRDYRKLKLKTSATFRAIRRATELVNEARDIALGFDCPQAPSASNPWN
jgi:hypothetical protein